MRQACHQYSLAPHTACNTVPPQTIGIVIVACLTVEVWIGLLLAMSACPMTLAVSGTTIPHMTKDMTLCALEPHLVVECL